MREVYDREMGLVSGVVSGESERGFVTGKSGILVSVTGGE